MSEKRSETDIQRDIQQRLGYGDYRLWRNQNGEGWIGGTFSVVNGQLVNGTARRIRFGLAVGAPDLIGGRSLIITPEMIGKRILQFGGLEVKTQTGRATSEQAAFIGMVKGLGGISGIVRSVEEARNLLESDLI